MDTGEIIVFGAFVFCTIAFIRSERESRRSNKRFEQRMRNLGFAVDGSRAPNTDEILSAENQEVRSAMIEGLHGYQGDVKKIDSGEAGELFITLSSPIKKFVKVINSTAESDGTFKTYWLRVPSHINTAKEAVAWTFGLDSNEYKPIIET